MRNLAQKTDPTSFASCPTWHKPFPAVWEHSCEPQRLWDPRAMAEMSSPAQWTGQCAPHHPDQGKCCLEATPLAGSRQVLGRWRALWRRRHACLFTRNLLPNQGTWIHSSGMWPPWGWRLTRLLFPQGRALSLLHRQLSGNISQMTEI